MNDELIIEILEMVETNMIGIMDKNTIAENLQTLLEQQKPVKNNVVLSDVSARLSSSLGECVVGNDYEIVADKDGRFWINHKEVGSGEPLEQWIDGVLNVC